MTADIRTAAQREAAERYSPNLMALHGGAFLDHNEFYRTVFVDGAVWAAARVTPTREQIAEVLNDYLAALYTEEDAVDAVLAPMQELAEGES